MGRPAWEPSERDLKQIETLAGYGLPNKHIAALVETTRVTLEKYANTEGHPVNLAITKGKALAAANVTKTLYEMIVNDRNVACTIFFCKTQLGWTENPINDDAENERRRPLSLVKREA